MEKGLTLEEEMGFGAATQEGKRQAMMEIRAREAEQTASRSMSALEKVAFSVATVFSTMVLIVLVLLTISGFIFSPITDTLIFGLLMIATGLTSYAIWRGGQRSAS